MRTISETSGTMLNSPTFESGLSEEEDIKKDHEKILEEIIVENFPKMGMEIITQVQETQSPKQDRPKAKHTKTHTNQTNKDQTHTHKNKY